MIVGLAVMTDISMTAASSSPSFVAVAPSTNVDRPQCRREAHERYQKVKEQQEKANEQQQKAANEQQEKAKDQLRACDGEQDASRFSTDNAVSHRLLSNLDSSPVTSPS